MMCNLHKATLLPLPGDQILACRLSEPKAGVTGHRVPVVLCQSPVSESCVHKVNGLALLEQKYFQTEALEP